MEPFGKNFSLKNLWNKEDWFSASRHTCFASIASLNFWSSLKPNPPKLFDWHNDFHFDQWIFLWLPFWPHQKFLIKASISWHRVSGSLKQLMAKVGISWITASRRTSHLAWKRSCSFQPWSFAATLSLIYSKLAFFFFPTREEGLDISHIAWSLAHLALFWSYPRC